MDRLERLTFSAMFLFATYAAVVSFLEYAFMPVTCGDFYVLLNGMTYTTVEFAWFWFAWSYTLRHRF